MPLPSFPVNVFKPGDSISVFSLFGSLELCCASDELAHWIIVNTKTAVTTEVSATIHFFCKLSTPLVNCLTSIILLFNCQESMETKENNRILKNRFITAFALLMNHCNPLNTSAKCYKER